MILLPVKCDVSIILLDEIGIKVPAAQDWIFSGFPIGSTIYEIFPVR